MAIDVPVFKRKIYNQLLEWKSKYSSEYAVLIEGARRIGKSTIAEEFAKNEYESYILIDFANVGKNILDIFENISELDLFFLRLSAETHVNLVERKSVIIFDEVQFFPKARQAIKYLVKDGRYDYIETGSLISIRKNVKNILIPSEEHKIKMYPMDYEEFMWAIGNNTFDLFRKMADMKTPIGESTNRKLMRDFHIYMAVGGMPQAVKAYIEKKNFDEIDRIKREIISLYEDDFKKIDPSGRAGKIYDAIPSQLAMNKKRFIISNATNKKESVRDKERLSDLIDSMTVLISYNTTEPQIAMNQSQNSNSYKLYLSDIGLFTTMLFNTQGGIHEDIYRKLLSDKLEANLGYLYENAVAQILASQGKRLFYHTWAKENSTHYFEVDFIVPSRTKIVPIEVKSSNIRNHGSITEFGRKYSRLTSRRILFSQKDIGNDGMLELKPIFLSPAVLEKL